MEIMGIIFFFLLMTAGFAAGIAMFALAALMGVIAVIAVFARRLFFKFRS